MSLGRLRKDIPALLSELLHTIVSMTRLPYNRCFAFQPRRVTYDTDESVLPSVLGREYKKYHTLDSIVKEFSAENLKFTEGASISLNSQPYTVQIIKQRL